MPQAGRPKDACLHKYGGIQFNYVLGSTTTYAFDLCQVIMCSGGPEEWRSYNVYLCDSRFADPLADMPPWCPYWNAVIWGTGPQDGTNTYAPQRPNSSDTHDLQKSGSLWRRPSHKGSGNSLGFTLDRVTTNPYQFVNATWGCRQNANSVYFVLGVDQAGKDTMGLLKINFVQPTKTRTSATNISPALTHTPSLNLTIIALDNDGHTRKASITPLTPADTLAISTGYSDKNLWLKWITATAASLNVTNCIACSTARPVLLTVPAPLYPSQDPIGYHCMLALTMQRHPPNCKTLDLIFPAVQNRTIPPAFTPAEGNYTCFMRKSGDHIGVVDPSWCKTTIDITSWSNATTMRWARADLFWYCGTNVLRPRLPVYWTGTCALVRLAVPLTLLGDFQEQTNPNSHFRSRRHATADPFDLSSSETYIDAIGVPRGVPDRYKLADQIAAGFENLPLISALFPVTPNKNVDRINYVHYNLQRLANGSRDAITGLSEQLTHTSLMAIQNRIALDMLLAEKGGVCYMFGEQCCTYIANNTAPDGSVTRALSGLKALSIEMAHNSGVSSSIVDTLDRWFGKWKSVVATVFVSLAGMTCVLVLVGCCCIPCLRSLCVRIMAAAFERTDPTPSYQLTAMARVSSDCGYDDYVLAIE